MQDELHVRPGNHLLQALALATTRYHEAAPDRIVAARIQYDEALYQFKMAQEQTSSREIGRRSEA
jgi:thermostable 8-oxoguanine DNA glycosylase